MDEKTGTNLPMFIRVYGTTNTVHYRDIDAAISRQGSVLVEARTGETHTDTLDRGVVEIMDMLEVSQLYNVWSEPVPVADALYELGVER